MSTPQYTPTVYQSNLKSVRNKSIGNDGWHCDDPIIEPDPCEPSVVYDDVYEATKNTGRDYTGEV